jgi:hydroxymethylpyrimidine pyrophosphatase-like HAD family hydrolase
MRKKYENDAVEIVRSYRSCIELISEFGSKRTASHKLKEALGAHTLICVGDFENDISMIEGADIGYAVDNACEALKAVADRITVHAQDGAIRAIVEAIEKSL